MGRIPSNYKHPAFLTDRYEAIEMIGQGGMDVLRGNRSVTKPGDNQVG